MKKWITYAALLIFMNLPATCPADGWDHTVYFDMGAEGENKAMTIWGMGTIGGAGIMGSGLQNMGVDQIDQSIPLQVTANYRARPGSKSTAISRRPSSPETNPL